MIKKIIVLVSFICLNSMDVCGVCVPIEVPFTWQLTQTGKNFAQAVVINDLGTGVSKSGTDSLAGEFIITAVHTPPTYYCSRVDPLPTQVTLQIVGTFTCKLANTTLALDPWGLTIDTYAKVNATVSAPPGFPAFTTSEIGGFPDSYDNTKTQNLAISVGPGTIPYSGSINIETLFGFGSATLGDILTAESILQVVGSLIGQTSFSITYLVPEPATVLILSLGGLLLRRKKIN